jgi:hypothetical protein
VTVGDTHNERSLYELARERGLLPLVVAAGLRHWRSCINAQAASGGTDCEVFQSPYRSQSIW